MPINHRPVSVERSGSTSRRPREPATGARDAQLHASGAQGSPPRCGSEVPAAPAWEPRDPHPRLLADHLEVLEGASRPSADFFTPAARRAPHPARWSARPPGPRPARRVVTLPRPPGRTCPPPGTAASTCDRGLRHLVAPGCLRDRHLAGQHGQHDPVLSSAENTGGRLIRSTPWIRAN